MWTVSYFLLQQRHRFSVTWWKGFLIGQKKSLFNDPFVSSRQKYGNCSSSVSKEISKMSQTVLRFDKIPKVKKLNSSQQILNQAFFVDILSEEKVKSCHIRGFRGDLKNVSYFPNMPNSAIRYQPSLYEHVSTDYSSSCFSLEKTTSVILHVVPPEFQKRSQFLKTCSDLTT